MLAFSLPRATSACEALRAGVLMLQKAHIESASLDARMLLEHVLGCTREQLLLMMDEALSSEQHAQYQQLIAQRAERKPVAQLLGKREFWGMEYLVTADTLDPRPDSETLIEELLARIEDRQKPYRILDLGTGTGCLCLSLLKELPNATAIGVDISEAALAVAKENSVRCALQSRASFIASRWCENVAGEFDIIVSNPPYIPSLSIESLAPEVALHEPKLALDGGEDGLDCYRDIIASLPRFLAKDGVALFEIGLGQQPALEAIAQAAGFQLAGARQDIGGIVRCVVFTK